MSSDIRLDPNCMNHHNLVDSDVVNDPKFLRCNQIDFQRILFVRMFEFQHNHQVIEAGYT